MILHHMKGKKNLPWQSIVHPFFSTLPHSVEHLTYLSNHHSRVLSGGYQLSFVWLLFLINCKCASRQSHDWLGLKCTLFLPPRVRLCFTKPHYGWSESHSWPSVRGAAAFQSRSSGEILECVGSVSYSLTEGRNWSFCSWLLNVGL